MSAQFDDIRAEVLPGHHLVTRLPGLVAVIRRDKSTDAALAQLLGLLRSASEANPAEPGRDLARQLTRWVVGVNSVPDFGTVATVGKKLAVFLHGDINFEEVRPPENQLADDAVQLAGSEAAFTVDRLLEWTGGAFALTVGAVEPAAVELVQSAVDIVNIPDWAGLRSGAVPGVGVVLNPRATRSGAPAVDSAPPPAAPGWTPPPAKSPVPAKPIPAEPTPSVPSPLSQFPLGQRPPSQRPHPPRRQHLRRLHTLSPYQRRLQALLIRPHRRQVLLGRRTPRGPRTLLSRRT